MILIKRILWVVLIFSVVIDLLILNHEENLFPGQNWPGFMAVYGFISCVLIIIISKWLGILGLSKKEDYYNE